jgi:hypothetical protein
MLVCAMVVSGAGFRGTDERRMGEPGAQRIARNLFLFAFYDVIKCAIMA